MTSTPQAVDSSRLPDDQQGLIAALIDLEADFTAVVRKMGKSGNTSYIPVLVDILRFPRDEEVALVVMSALNKLLEGPDVLTIKQERTERRWWAEWLGNHPEIRLPEGYAAWKGQLFSLIDRELGAFFYEGVKAHIRLEEIVWGGVVKDGIPDLANPPVISAKEAIYLSPSDRVFGVSINGQHRAYPLRILNAHEMANDVVGGVPIALAY
jgi:hypothetical protein